MYQIDYLRHLSHLNITFEKIIAQRQQFCIKPTHLKYLTNKILSLKITRKELNRLSVKSKDEGVMGSYKNCFSRNILH